MQESSCTVGKKDAAISHEFTKEVIKDVTKYQLGSTMREFTSCNPPTQWSVLQFEFVMLLLFAVALSVMTWRKAKLQLLTGRS